MSEPGPGAAVPQELLPTKGVSLSEPGPGGVARGDLRAAEGIA